MTVRGFDELAHASGARVADLGRLGSTFTAPCPACGGRLLAWTWRPGPNDRPGFRCADCGRRGELTWLDLLLRRIGR